MGASFTGRADYSDVVLSMHYVLIADATSQRRLRSNPLTKLACTHVLRNNRMHFGTPELIIISAIVTTTHRVHLIWNFDTSDSKVECPDVCTAARQRSLFFDRSK